MKREVQKTIAEAAEETYKHHSLVNAYILSRKLGVELGIVRTNLIELGYSEHTPNLFVRRKKFQGN